MSETLTSRLFGAKHRGAIPEFTFGWRLARALAYAGMSVIDMAEYLDVHRSTCSRWMNDHGAPPKPIYVRAWAERTGVDHDWLVTGIVPDDRRPDDEYAPRDSNPEPAD